MTDIKRIDITQPPGPRMSRCVVHGGVCSGGLRRRSQ